MACDKDEVVVCGHDLFQSVWDFPIIGEVNRRLDLIDDHLEWLVDVMWRIHPFPVQIEVRHGNLVAIGI